jgi:DNA adenine methylase
MDSFLRWAGSKRRLAKDIAPLLAGDWDCYLEPFAGSASMFFALPETVRTRKCILADANVVLATTLREVMTDPLHVMNELRDLRARQAEQGHAAFYNWLKGQVVQKNARQAARFIALNQLCFNGLYRVNKAGKFNVPIGKSSTGAYYDLSLPNLQMYSDYMQIRNTTVMHSGEFWMPECEGSPERWILGSRDIAYCDPPYLKQFSSYTANGFGANEHTKLANWARYYARHGARIVISGANNEATRAIYGEPALVLGREDCIGVGTRRATSECVFVFD